LANPTELLQGTLDLLILKAISLGPLHGYAIARRIKQCSAEALEIEDGSLYPALNRMLLTLGRAASEAPAAGKPAKE